MTVILLDANIKSTKKIKRRFKLKTLKILLFFIMCFFSIETFAQTPSQHAEKNNRFLLLLTSYKRPMLLSGQILRLMNQTYSNFKISISIKGTPEKWIKKTFFQEWQPFIDQQKITIRFDDNKDQLSNLLDTIKDINTQDYDYFCKIDDDDWYAPNYLETVNHYLNKEKNIDLTMTRNAVILNNGHPQVEMSLNETNLAGPTMCFSKKILNALISINKDPKALNPIYKEEVLYRREKQEDALIHHLAQKAGKVQIRSTPNEQIIYGKQYPSVTRKCY